jgi:hypothetical protein
MSKRSVSREIEAWYLAEKEKIQAEFTNARGGAAAESLESSGQTEIRTIEKEKAWRRKVIAADHKATAAFRALKAARLKRYEEAGLKAPPLPARHKKLD